MTGFRGENFKAGHSPIKSGVFKNNIKNCKFYTKNPKVFLKIADIDNKG